MAAPTGAEALKIALSDWRRNAAALLSGAVVVAAAVAVRFARHRIAFDP